MTTYTLSRRNTLTVSILLLPNLQSSFLHVITPTEERLPQALTPVCSLPSCSLASVSTTHSFSGMATPSLFPSVLKRSALFHSYSWNRKPDIEYAPSPPTVCSTSISNWLGSGVASAGHEQGCDGFEQQHLKKGSRLGVQLAWENKVLLDVCAWPLHKVTINWHRA